MAVGCCIGQCWLRFPSSKKILLDSPGEGSCYHFLIHILICLIIVKCLPLVTLLLTILVRERKFLNCQLCLKAKNRLQRWYLHLLYFFGKWCHTLSSAVRKLKNDFVFTIDCIILLGDFPDFSVTFYIALFL